MKDKLQKIKDAVFTKDWLRTHWEDCVLDKHHKDCAILWLITEVERLRKSEGDWQDAPCEVLQHCETHCPPQ